MSCTPCGTKSCDVNAQMGFPGVIRQRRHGGVTIERGALGAAFAALFEGTDLHPAAVEDFVSSTWRKLVLNSVGAVNALTLKPAGIARNDRAAWLMQAIGSEAVSVGRAVGARLNDGLPEQIVAGYRASASNTVNSLLADRLAGRPMEIDARNGVIVRLGAAHGVPTPFNAMAVAVLEAAADPRSFDATPSPST